MDRALGSQSEPPWQLMYLLYGCSTLLQNTLCGMWFSLLYPNCFMSLFLVIIFFCMRHSIHTMPGHFDFN